MTILFTGIYLIKKYGKIWKEQLQIQKRKKKLLGTHVKRLQEKLKISAVVVCFRYKKKQWKTVAVKPTRIILIKPKFITNGIKKLNECGNEMNLILIKRFLIEN